jgi:hypothetical protein
MCVCSESAGCKACEFVYEKDLSDCFNNYIKALFLYVCIYLNWRQHQENRDNKRC